MKDAQARDLRRQIDELRAQLARYAEALEEDLARAARRSRRARAKARNFEKAFSDVSTLLLNHLKAKPEARDLLQELMPNMHNLNAGGGNSPQSARSPGGPESRGPGV